MSRSLACSVRCERATEQCERKKITWKSAESAYKTKWKHEVALQDALSDPLYVRHSVNFAMQQPKKPNHFLFQVLKMFSKRAKNKRWKIVLFENKIRRKNKHFSFRSCHVKARGREKKQNISENFKTNQMESEQWPNKIKQNWVCGGKKSSGLLWAGKKRWKSNNRNHSVFDPFFFAKMRPFVCNGVWKKILEYTLYMETLFYCLCAKCKHVPEDWVISETRWHPFIVLSCIRTFNTLWLLVSKSIFFSRLQLLADARRRSFCVPNKVDKAIFQRALHSQLSSISSD